MSGPWLRIILTFTVTLLVLYGLSRLTYRESWMKTVLAPLGAAHELLLWVGITFVALLALIQGHGGPLSQYAYFVFILSLNVFLFWITFTKRTAQRPLWLRISSNFMLAFTAAVLFLYGLSLQPLW